MATPLSNYQIFATGVTGTQPSFNMDTSISPYNVTIAVWVVGGSASFKMQWSFDDYATVSDANARWFDDPQIPAGTAASIYENYQFLATRGRIVIATNTGGLELKVLQGFSKN